MKRVLFWRVDKRKQFKWWICPLIRGHLHEDMQAFSRRSGWRWHRFITPRSNLGASRGVNYWSHRFILIVYLLAGVPRCTLALFSCLIDRHLIANQTKRQRFSISQSITEVDGSQRDRGCEADIIIILLTFSLFSPELTFIISDASLQHMYFFISVKVLIHCISVNMLKHSIEDKT